MLGLLSQPTEEEVKRAFRRLALKYHPDKVLTREKSFPKHHSIFHIIIVSLIFLLISFSKFISCRMTLSGRRKNSRKLTKRTKRCWPKTGRRSPGARKVNGKARNPLSVPAVGRLWRTGTLTSAIYNYTRGIDDEIEMWPSSPSFNLMKCWPADVGQFLRLVMSNEIDN